MFAHCLCMSVHCFGFSSVLRYCVLCICAFLFVRLFVCLSGRYMGACVRVCGRRISRVLSSPLEEAGRASIGGINSVLCGCVNSLTVGPQHIISCVKEYLDYHTTKDCHTGN